MGLRHRYETDDEIDHQDKQRESTVWGNVLPSFHVRAEACIGPLALESVSTLALESVSTSVCHGGFTASRSQREHIRAVAYHLAGSYPTPRK